MILIPETQPFDDSCIDALVYEIRDIDEREATYLRFIEAIRKRRAATEDLVRLLTKEQLKKLRSALVGWDNVQAVAWCGREEKPS